MVRLYPHRALQNLARLVSVGIVGLELRPCVIERQMLGELGDAFGEASVGLGETALRLVLQRARLPRSGPRRLRRTTAIPATAAALVGPRRPGAGPVLLSTAKARFGHLEAAAAASEARP